ncbi:MAG: SMC-Scp complex subunit ScpB [Acidaminobacteraceae bacterium]
MGNRRNMSIIESLLFVWSEPLTISKMASILDVAAADIRIDINELMVEYTMRQSGIQIIKVNDAYQLASIQENSHYIEKLCKTSKGKGLSSSAFEILAIVAYKQPITKGEIDFIRGVKSDKSIASLMDRSLIEAKGRLKKIGNPIVYGTSEMFLKSFGFSSLKELPNIADFENSDKFFNAFLDRDGSLETEEGLDG